MDSHCLPAYYVLGVSLLAEERVVEAIQVLEGGVALYRDSMLMAYLAMASAMSGWHRRAEELLAELRQRAMSQHVFATSFAFIEMGRGNYEAALDWLERAVAERDPHVLWMKVSPRWDPLREHPRFVQVVRALGAPKPTASVR
jgi:serine/threonine-protein kinase